MDKLEKILHNFKDRKVLIVGDIMLDTYLKGEVSRISAEAPSPILKVDNEYNLLGGAGNVASNIVSLGGKAILFSFIGDDTQGEILKRLLKEHGIESFLDKDDKTTQKIRIISGNQQLARADREETKEKTFSQEFKTDLEKKAVEADVIVISDYNKGAITRDLMDFLKQFQQKIIVDPKPINKELYKDVFLITPNEKEIIEMTSVEDIEQAGNKLKEELRTNVLLTRGRNGMSLFSDKRVDIPTYAREVFNVVGAGDTAISALALAISSGASINEAAIIANYAAGITVEKEGTYSVSFSELASRILRRESKICDIEKLQRIVEDLKKKNKKIVWTNGCFDLLHIGHTRYLKEAKKLGDVLIVGINSDSSVRQLKGPTRPLQTESERAEILSSLDFVDYSIIFPELTVEKYLKELQPDFYVKGEDYSLESINQEEKKAMESYNGQIKFVQYVEGKSSSSLIEKATQQNNYSIK